MLSYLNCAADYGTMDHSLKQRVRSPKKWQALGEQLAAEDPITRAFLGTTQAIDLIHGGVKVNALPEFTTATVNYRIDFLESVNGTATRIADLLAPVVKSFNLTFDVYGSHSHVNNNVVRLSLTSGSGIEPAPLASTEGPAFELMSGTAKHVFPGAVVAPSAMIGEFGILSWTLLTLETGGKTSSSLFATSPLTTSSDGPSIYLSQPTPTPNGHGKSRTTSTVLFLALST